MVTRLRRKLFQVLGPVFGACLVVYFAYYTVQGDRGLMTLTRLQIQAAKSEAQLATVQAQREELQRRVASLRPESLDIDRLDERARMILNYSHPDDLIVLAPKL
jgi:cell division protein FtsB